MSGELLAADDLYHCHLRILHVSDTTEQALMDSTAITFSLYVSHYFILGITAKALGETYMGHYKSLTM